MTHRAERVSWTRPEPGLLTAMRHGEVVGHVLSTRAGFIAFDAARTPLGCFKSPGRARRAVATPAFVSKIAAPAWLLDTVGAVDRWVSNRFRRFPTTPA